MNLKYRARKITVARLGLATLTAAAVSVGGLTAFTSANVRHADSVNTTPINIPTEKGVPGLPGPVADSANPASNMGTLTVSPQVGFAGTPMHISGSGLAANTSVTLTWSTANDTWVVDPEPGTVNYLGFQRSKLNVVLGHVNTDGNGAFSTTINAPNDWGGVHDIYADYNGTQEAHGGFLISRKLIIRPKSGPIGTPIHITYTGFSPSLYELGAALLWDNHFTGEMQAVWTRGTAQVTVRAAGPVGWHTLEVGDAISFLYLNLQQASDSWAIGGTASFHTTADKGRPKAQVWWPQNIPTTLDAKTTLGSSVVDSNSNVKLTLSSYAGQVGQRKIQLTATSLTPNQPVDLEWGTVVGTRVNCTSTCWAYTTIPVTTVTPTSSTLNTTIQVPDNLGGWHGLLLNQGGNTMAQVAFNVRESIVGKGVSSLLLKPGQAFTIHLKGVGWTQLDNTVGVDYDNSYMGYGCGFASNGDVVLNLHATGGRGTHIIDTYPQFYTLSPSFTNTQWGLVPVLTYARDYPGLAMGYRIPSIKLAITIK